MSAPVWSFLGPAGTFSEMALRAVAPAGVDAQPCPDVPTALDRVREREAASAVVPIENSVEGGVNATIDNLIASSPLVITAEVAINITFVLAGRAGTRLEDVRAISTHPHAWAQCRGWAHATLPTPSTWPAPPPPPPPRRSPRAPRSASRRSCATRWPPSSTA
ncbi:prephenate dehydratase [Actinomyces denticolens]|nr:prephenate dehydratase [Actinomyces denticolens]